jgi:hypothetical protein
MDVDDSAAVFMEWWECPVCGHKETWICWRERGGHTEKWNRHNDPYSARNLGRRFKRLYGFNPYEHLTRRA